jgi:hypothetical protein
VADETFDQLLTLHWTRPVEGSSRIVAQASYHAEHVRLGVVDRPT